MKKFKQNKGYGGRDKREDQATYRATCSDCGRPCQVPFKPNKEKPVYCNDCFVPRGLDGNKDNRKMYKATCSDCGQRCEIPFKPSKGKEIYCKDCFGKESSLTSHKTNHSDDKHDEINAKLDKILALLQKTS